MNQNVLADLFGLDGRVALVTGAGSGIGRGVAELLAQAGARVVVADLNLAAAEATATAIGGGAFAVQMDVSDPASVDAGFARIADADCAADVLVNNAGIYATAPLMELTAQQWDKIHAVNTRGTFLCLQGAVRAMRAAGKGGSIINISSVNSIGACIFDNTHYASSKGGVNAITVATALELAEFGIRVNAIMPGAVATEGADALTASGYVPTRGQITQPGRIPLSRRGMPRDIASACLFFASEASSYVTGEIIAVDGGFHIS